MRLLIDTHALIWSADQETRLSQKAQDVLTDSSNQLNLSIASGWEIAIKVGLQKLQLSLPYNSWMDQVITNLGLKVLPVLLEHCRRLTELPRHHGDPFDRMMIVQALHEGLPIVSQDAHFDAYGVQRIW